MFYFLFLNFFSLLSLYTNQNQKLIIIIMVLIKYKQNQNLSVWFINLFTRDSHWTITGAGMLQATLLSSRSANIFSFQTSELLESPWRNGQPGTGVISQTQTLELSGALLFFSHRNVYVEQGGGIINGWEFLLQPSAGSGCTTNYCCYYWCCC